MNQEPTTAELLEAIIDFRDGVGFAMQNMETRLGDRIDSLDHRLSERMTRMEDRLTVRIDGLEGEMHAGFHEMHEGFEAVNKRIDGLEPPKRRGIR